MADERKHLNAEMLYYLFNAANMHRWNDHYRTVDFTELDKQAHKAIIAWVLGKCEEDAGRKVDWVKIIRHTLFSFIQRVAITDLKPPIYYKILETEKEKIYDYAFKEFCDLVKGMPESFTKDFRNYLDTDHDDIEDRIIDAAHYLATRYEFNLIYEVNKTSYGIEETAKGVLGQIDNPRYKSLAGMQYLVDDSSPLYGFINLLGQLRCQQRWARAPREPKTTVLGHCILVADSIFLHDLDVHADENVIYNDFYSGLFHDLPEVLTKDVITPVKNSSEGLPDLLGEIEKMEFKSKVLPLVSESWHRELGHMALTPFSEIPGFERNYDAIKACDNLAAWMEAYISTQYGIAPRILRDALKQISKKLLTEGRGEKIGAAKILIDFQNMDI